MVQLHRLSHLSMLSALANPGEDREPMNIFMLLCRITLDEAAYFTEGTISAGTNCTKLI
jgi:hypothetical protein